VSSDASAFQFWGCSEIRESLGQRADGERQMLERLETIPPESIYYHSVRCLMRRQVVPSPYPDDFARWVALEVRDPVLAERLALHSPFDFPSIEAFRAHLLGPLLFGVVASQVPWRLWRLGPSTSSSSWKPIASKRPSTRS